MYTPPTLPSATSLGGFGCQTISQGSGISEPTFNKENLPISAIAFQKRIPVKIILNEDEEVVSLENHSESTDENSLYHFASFSSHSRSNLPSYASFNNLPIYNNFNNGVLSNSFNYNSNLLAKERKVVYIFNILKSRKKEKKYLRKKYNKVISRVHNMDCLLKKIKAKFLKFLFLNIKKDLKDLKIDVKKFDQCKEVRNLNVPHNRDKFINLTILEVLVNNEIIDQHECQIIFSSDNQSLKDFLTTKVKYQYQFEFLKSTYFRNWLKDPIKITTEILVKDNKNCEKFPNHSKNIFKTNIENYERYKKLLLHTACNFLFYFQNNPLKFGKKQRD